MEPGIPGEPNGNPPEEPGGTFGTVLKKEEFINICDVEPPESLLFDEAINAEYEMLKEPPSICRPLHSFLSHVLADNGKM